MDRRFGNILVPMKKFETLKQALPALYELLEAYHDKTLKCPLCNYVETHNGIRNCRLCPWTILTTKNRFYSCESGHKVYTSWRQIRTETGFKARRRNRVKQIKRWIRFIESL